MERVLITGITGYVGSHLGKQLLEGYSDKFILRVAVRNVKKLEPLKKEYGEELFSKLEIRVADLLNKEALAASVEGCQYIVHLANPVVGT
jgi:nucleoside-diphosphate-sugar epimerase